MKIDGLPPPNVVDIYIFFLYLAIRGLLFWTIWSFLFGNWRKNERFLFFQKWSMKSENMGGGRIFFLKLRQSLNFPQISKRMAPTCSEEQSPYRKNNKKYIYIYIYKGGREPLNFQLTPKKLLIWKLTGSPPLMWGEGIFLDIFL